MTNFDTWWRSKDARFRAAMLKEDMREAWQAGRESMRSEAVNVCDSRCIGYLEDDAELTEIIKAIKEIP